MRQLAYTMFITNMTKNYTLFFFWWKKNLVKHQKFSKYLDQDCSYISLQILPDKGNLGIHFFLSKHDCYFEPLGYVMGRWAVLNFSSILFKELELHCGYFVPLCNFEVLFHKISNNRILRSSSLIYIRLEPSIPLSV